MPHLGIWTMWRHSSFVEATLEAGTSYTLVISEDAFAVNMSERAFFDVFDGPGGRAGRLNQANIANVMVVTTLVQP
jgi:hypothetical protein